MVSIFQFYCLLTFKELITTAADDFFFYFIFVFFTENKAWHYHVNHLLGR